MSARLYGEAVRHYLRLVTGLNLPDRECDFVGPDGKPPAAWGGVNPYYGVYAHQLSDQGWETCFMESLEVEITVTQRLNGPLDRIGPVELNKAVTGMFDKLQVLKAFLLNNNYTIMNYVNTSLGSPASPYFRPLYYRRTTIAQVSGDWFFADASVTCGLVGKMTFGGAYRAQYLGDVA